MVTSNLIFHFMRERRIRHEVYIIIISNKYIPTVSSAVLQWNWDDRSSIYEVWQRSTAEGVLIYAGTNTSFLFYFAAWIRQKFITLISTYLCQQIHNAIKHFFPNISVFTALEIFRETGKVRRISVFHSRQFSTRTVGKTNLQAHNHHLSRFVVHLGKLRDLSFDL